MAYFAQAGYGQAYTQGGVQDAGAAHEGQYQHYQQHAHPVDQGYAPEYGFGGPDGMQPEYDADDYGAQPPAGQGGVMKALGMLGAAASLALVAGLGLWGYKLIVRDVSGVPVVRAVEGPMRVQPENPGGRPADHQGLAVNAVAATGTAEDPADRLTLAPDAMKLTEDDKPAAELAAAAAPAPEAAPVPAESAEAAQSSDIEALLAELTGGPEDAGETPAAQPAAAPAPAIVQPEPLRPVELAAAEPAARISPALLNAPGIKVSLRPNVRPARFTPAPAAASPQQARATLEVDPDSLPAGTRLAQLGAYESPEVARAEWDRIHGRFADYLEGKKRVIQRAQSGGRIFYRLRAMGFDDLSDARRFCSALVAGNADCIPVTTR
ncbi:SPOR domain-containing protein [Roseobacteraceae bacterium NS-SX3]